jgi:hypothetical protein
VQPVRSAAIKPLCAHLNNLAKLRPSKINALNLGVLPVGKTVGFALQAVYTFVNTRVVITLAARTLPLARSPKDSSTSRSFRHGIIVSIRQTIGLRGSRNPLRYFLPFDQAVCIGFTLCLVEPSTPF